MSQATPRIPPITPPEWTDAARDMFAIKGGPQGRTNGSKYNSIKVMARIPEISASFLVFNEALTQAAALPMRVREIAILRVAHLNHNEYEWVWHCISGRRIGLTEADFDAIKAGKAQPDWSALEVLTLQTVDQLEKTKTVDDALWAALSEHLSHRDIMELLYLIGAYTALALLFNAAGVQVEQDLI